MARRLARKAGLEEHPHMPTFVGELDGHVTPRLERIVEALNGAGFATTVSTRILTEFWKKLCINVTSLPTPRCCASTRTSLRRMKQLAR